MGSKVIQAFAYSHLIFTKSQVFEFMGRQENAFPLIWGTNVRINAFPVCNRKKKFGRLDDINDCLGTFAANLEWA
jgi:hypothetical protein